MEDLQGCQIERKEEQEEKKAAWFASCIFQ